MSIQGVVKAKCPSGCEPFETEVWSLVRGDKDAELKETLLAGELNLLCCPDCRKYFYPEEMVVYYDPDAEIFAFIFPYSYKAEEKKWRLKMDDDYKILKERLLKEKKFSFEPKLFFGFEGLKKLLEDELNREDETRIIEYLAVELGLKTRRVKPSYARDNDLPRVIPFSSGIFTKDSVMEGSKRVLSRNEKIASLGKFLKMLESGGDCGLPPVLE